MKNIMDVAVGVVGYFLFGWAFAYGDNTVCDEAGVCTSVQNAFIGSTQFAMKDMPSTTFHTWFFQFVFAISTATIVSGAVAERVTMLTYVLYAFFLTAWVYPVLSHWVWSTSGWASTTRVTGPLFLGTGVYDTVGSGAVHMVGGVAAFMGAWISGPRMGRFDAHGKPRDMPGHNNVFYVAGVLLLWLGFFCFNSGTMAQLVDPTGASFAGVVSRCVISTTLGGGFGAVTCVIVKLFISKLTGKKAVWCLMSAGNGALCGMIVITSGCATFAPWAAAVGGIIGGLLYWPSSLFILHVLKVDDVVDATVVHAVAGAAGVLWYALMANKNYVTELYGATNPDGSERAYGWWMGDGPTIVWANLVWIFVIIGWTAFWMGGFFYLLKVCKLLRVSISDETAGMDVSHHGGAAYYDEVALMDGDKPANGFTKHSPSGMDSEVEILRSDIIQLTRRLNAMEAAKPGAHNV
jgi:Amt family ammonium transporter